MIVSNGENGKCAGDVMHIALATDAAFKKFAAITIASVVANMRPDDNVVFHILYDDPEDSLLPELDFCRGDERIKISVIVLKKEDFADCPPMRWSRAVYYRLVLPDLLPELDKIIYLDSDLLVLDDIRGLWDIPLGDKLIAGVPSPCSDSHRKKLGIKGTKYFNSGVIMMNLKKMHESAYPALFKKMIAEKKDVLKYPDQDLLNMVFDDRFLELHPRWNVITTICRHDPDPRNYSVAAFFEALDDPGIVHFTGDYKPWKWFKSNHHPYAEEMEKYARMAGQRGIARIIAVKKLFFPRYAIPRKKISWDTSRFLKK